MNKKNHAYLRWLSPWALTVAVMGLNACVTINIYFPAAAAEKAADKVIDEIWQIPAGQAPSTDQRPAPAATPAAPPVNQEPQ